MEDVKIYKEKERVERQERDKERKGRVKDSIMEDVKIYKEKERVKRQERDKERKGRVKD